MNAKPELVGSPVAGAPRLFWLHCVLCGEPVIKSPFQQTAVTFPPVCELHARQVFDEAWRNMMMWPYGWYGHCCRAVNDVPYWIVDCTPEDESEGTS